VTGAVIEGSYRAGWQDKLHGASNEEIAGSQAKSADAAMKQQQSKMLPEDAIGATSDYYGVVGKSKAISNSLTVAESVVSPTGVFEMVGKIVGAGIGGLIGFGAGLLAAETGAPITLAIAGGRIGSEYGANLGRRFDYPGAGEANYNEWEGYAADR